MTQTIKVPIRVTTVEEVMTEITLPAYYVSKGNLYHYKVISADTAICVTEIESINRYRVEVTNISFAFSDSVPSSDVAFYEAYARVNDRLQVLSGIELHQLKQEQAWEDNLEDRREAYEDFINDPKVVNHWA